MPKSTTRIVLAATLLVPLASCGKGSTNPALIGKWEGKVDKKVFYLTFEKDGQMTWGGDIASMKDIFPSFAILTDFGIHPGKNTPITYKCISDTQLEVEGDLTAMLEKLSAGGDGRPSPDWKEKLRPKDTLTFAVSGKELTLTSSLGKSTKLQRAD